MAHWLLNSIPDEVCDAMQREFSILQSLPIVVDFGVSFEYTIARLCNGTVLNSQGMIDVVHSNGAYSLKTKISNNKSGVVKVTAHRLPSKHLNIPAVDFISGLHTQQIGATIIAWYNSKIANVLAQYPDFRTLLLVRNKELTQASIYEYQYELLDPNQFVWSKNKSDIYEATYIATGEVWYTWSPFTSHFEMQFKVPSDAKTFALTNEKISFDEMVCALTLNPKNNPVDIDTTACMMAASETPTEPANTDYSSDEILRAGDIECSTTSTLPISFLTPQSDQFHQGWVKQLLNALSSVAKRMTHWRTGKMLQSA